MHHSKTPHPDDLHRAWQVGYDEGYAKGQMAASEELALQWLADLSREYEGLAVETAYQRHGREWAAAIFEQAQP